jgi:hypothetical protein
MLHPLNYESSRVPNPPALTVVASLFIAYGAIGILWMICSRVMGRGLFIDIGSVFILIWGFGLIRRIRACYDMAIVVLWLPMIIVPLAIVFAAFRPPVFTFLGTTLGSSCLTVAIVLAIGTGVFLLTLWQYRVLRRPDIRILFKEEPRP